MYRLAPLATLAMVLGVGAQHASASPMRLDYSVTPAGGGLYNYDFTLTLDNNDNSWAAGQGFGWLIFGDAAFPGPSPLADFTMTSSFPVGPWTYLSGSSGGHNGPTFGFVLDNWVPTGVGDQLTWSGTSSANLGQGELLFSFLVGTNGTVRPNFQEANLLQPSAIPEPASLAVFGFLAGGAGFVYRRRKLAAV